MLVDIYCNDVYEKVLFKVVKFNSLVLDIGMGFGLLLMMVVWVGVE